MKIHVAYRENESLVEPLKITSAKYLSDFKILITFNDSAEQIVDFKPFLKKSMHPSIKKYLDKNQFSKFQIIDGNLNWNDYDMIFPLLDLRSGKIA